MKPFRHIILSLTLLVILQANSVEVQWFSSTSSLPWQMKHGIDITDFKQDEVDDVIITHYKEQQMLGFGGCFGELGWDALQLLDKDARHEVLVQLFDPVEGAGFAYCRTPIGANDFARDYYSLDDVRNDFKMKHFSIERDRTALIPYIKSALAINPDLQLWACPWTPPIWMKTNGHYATKAGQGNGYVGNDMIHGQDQFILEKKYLRAYADYFSKYLTQYKREGINIRMIMFQNEPFTINIWPNCSWSPQGSALFIGKYLGPQLRKAHKDVQIWHGTMNTDNIDEVTPVLDHPEASQYITGTGLQWEGKGLVSKLRSKYPGMPMMCTENECGNGDNDWAAAEHTFDMIKSYVEDGVNAYMYFNMVLRDRGTSSWGWNQNSLVVIDSKEHTATFTPEFYLMKHLSRHVKPQSYKLKTMGNDSDMLAFRNPDGSTVLVIANKKEHEHTVKVAIGHHVLHLKLDKKSFNSFLIK